MKKATLDQASKILSVFEDAPLDQVQAILGSGLLADLREANIGEIDRDEFRRVCGLESIVPKFNLLEPLGTITIPATTEKFIARNKFVVNTSNDAPVKINYLGDNFTEWFLNGDGKVEDPASEQKLCYANLQQSSVDKPIIAELGGEAKVETTLASLFSLMEKQKNGKNGVLLNNGYANIFYIRDQKDLLRAVFARWLGHGWNVSANSVENPHGWLVGARVFSSNS